MTFGGEITTLRAGEYAAQVASVGASLVQLTVGGRHLVQSRDPARLAEGYEGAALVPWPNRIVGGRYAVDGEVLEVPVNEAATGAALHGLGAFQHWRLVESSGSRGVWELDLPATQGYPFDVRCQMVYELDAESGLTVTVTGTNAGERPAPFGASWHPYLSCDERPLAECSLTVPAQQVLLCDERMAPTEVVPVDGTHADLREPTLLGDRLIDNALTGLPEGEWEVVLTHPETPGTTLVSDARWVQVYSGDRIGHRGVGVEPMTCPPDAFNSDPASVLLPPGQTRTLTMRIRSSASR